MKHNVLGPNQTQLHFYPYFGESVPDEVYQRLEDIYASDVPGRGMALLLGERARAYEEYIDAFLEEIGCTMQDVLYYLLNQKNTNLDPLYVGRDRHCRDGFNRSSERWQSVFSTLPCSSASALQKASMACTAFLGLAGFSLWHVARKSDYASPPVKIAAVEEPINILNSLTCRVCHM